ncbi:MAG: hypothetical protein LBL47_04020 [Lactobacillus sp.]|jgi:hypothetical protein|nr:hypothetical protein [Lactobacillus sp.]
MPKIFFTAVISATIIFCSSPAWAHEKELLEIIKRLEARVTELEKQVQKQTKENTPVVAAATVKKDTVVATASKEPLSTAPEIKTTDSPDLEERVARLEEDSIKAHREHHDHSSSVAFKPSIGIVLNGGYRYSSREHTHIRGFQIGHEGEKGDSGFSLGESEIMLSANVDDMFMGNLTLAVVNEDGEDKIEIEEAYIKTLALPYGLSVKAGRMLPTFGYLNDKHIHSDDFYERPLPYRAYLNNHYKDDGVQISVVLPTDFYSEIGGGAYKGGGFPADTDGDSDIGSYNLYARVGSDIGDSQTWAAGVSYLHTKVGEDGRYDSHGHSHSPLYFNGKDKFYGLDFKYTYSPNGNNHENEFALQGEYIFRDEKGSYDAGSGFKEFNSHSNGWYLQSTYKFHPKWRVGYRYSELNPKSAPADFVGTLLDSKGHDPHVHSAMVEWNNSEFSRIRLQYNYDASDYKPDNQIILQYTMGFTSGKHHHD